jgi:hypothetical protein
MGKKLIGQVPMTKDVKVVKNIKKSVRVFVILKGLSPYLLTHVCPSRLHLLAVCPSRLHLLAVCPSRLHLLAVCPSRFQVITLHLLSSVVGSEDPKLSTQSSLAISLKWCSINCSNLLSAGSPSPYRAGGPNKFASIHLVSSR